MNGCHSLLHPNRLQAERVYHSNGSVSWPYVFSRECQYIKQEHINDENCDGCKEKDKQKWPT